MIIAVAILIVGVVLSAFFSGSETGFYRVNRVRLVLDALGGSVVARGLIVLTNRPSIFVATVLVGNNIANYLVSLAIVLGAQALYGSESLASQIAAPIILSPLLFIYGELMPKSLFYEAPNRLLRSCGPPLLFCTVLFLPVTTLLWAMSRLLEIISGESPQKVQLALARRELQQVLDEGHEAGILHPAQRALAQGLFSVANQTVDRFVIPQVRVPRVREGAPIAEIRNFARRHRLSAVPVEGKSPDRPLLGYYLAVELYLNGETPPLRPLVTIKSTDLHLDALMRLETSNEMLGHVVDGGGRTVGFLTARHLSEPLFRGV
jgi:CBS domain containing-hemolysin-like protein